MKKVIMLAILMVLAFGLYAQNIRVAYINSNRIMRESNDTREAQRLLMLERENWDSEIDDLTAEVQRLEREYETRRLTLTEVGRREAEERIMARMRERQQLIERIYGENGIAERRHNELIAPIMDKLHEVLQKIATEENYSMIFDASSSGLAWAQERLDITQQVIIEMNRFGGGR